MNLFNLLRQYTTLEEMPRFANRHGVAGLLYDEIVESGANPSDTRWIVKLSGYAQKQRKRYDLQRDAIASLARFYSKHDIKMLVFKGYALSLLYDVPENRRSGDVDIYLFGEGEKADELLTNLGKQIKQQEDKHSEFDWRGVHIENHAVFLNIRNDFALFELEDYLEKQVSNYSLEDPDMPNVYLPNENFNALFLVLHFSKHWADYETSLRHLYDWAVFLKKCSDKVDWETICTLINKAGLAHFFYAMNDITCRIFEIDRSLVPTGDVDKSLADKILFDIIYPSDKLKFPEGSHGLERVWKQSVRYIHRYNRNNIVRKRNFFSALYAHTMRFIRARTNLDTRSIWKMEHVKKHVKLF